MEGVQSDSAFVVEHRSVHRPDIHLACRFGLQSHRHYTGVDPTVPNAGVEHDVLAHNIVVAKYSSQAKFLNEGVPDDQLKVGPSASSIRSFGGVEIAVVGG